MPFTTALQQSRLNHVTGTSYPTTPAGNFVAIYAGTMPNAAGVGGTEIASTRAAITLGTPAADANGRQYITHAAAVTVTLTNTTTQAVVGWGIFAAATGGTVIYHDRFPSVFNIAPGNTYTIPAGTIKVYSDQ